MSRYAVPALLLILWPGIVAGAITDPRLILHVAPDQPGCEVAVDCWNVMPSASVTEPGLMTVYLLVQQAEEDYPSETINGVQTAFDWDGWTLISSGWSCLPGQVTSHVPAGPGPDVGTLTTSFDAILEGTLDVVGWMRMEATTGALRQIESSAPSGTHVTDGAGAPRPVAEYGRGLARVGGPGMIPCDAGCNDPLSVSCDTNILEAPDIYAVGSQVTATTLGDVDLDLDIDIVTSAGGYLTVLRGSGDGTFAAPEYHQTDVGRPYLEDRNGDTILDLVARRWSAPDFGVMFGIGDGTFADPVIYPAPPLGDVCLVDLNDDGLNDVVGMQGNDVGVLLSDQYGGFLAPTTQALGETIARLDAGLVDQDDFADLALIVRNTTTLDPEVRVYAGNGDGTFDFATPLFTYGVGETRGLSLSDLTGNGILDLTAIHYVDNFGQTYARSFIGQGDGSFVPVGGSDEIATCGRLAGAADIDGDGLPDLITTGGGNCTSHAFCGFAAQLLVQAGDGSGSFGADLEDCQYGLGRYVQPTLADLDGDTALDIVVSADPAVIVYRSAPATSIAATPAPIRQRLLRAAPNPLRRSTEIRFTIDEPGPVSLSIYDAAGRHVRTLLDGTPMAAGERSLIWNATDSSGSRVVVGIYAVRLVVGSHQSVEKLLVIR